MKDREGPRDSEIQAGEWLGDVAEDVCYVGGGVGPPDFVIRHRGEEVAIEVTGMQSGVGWEPTQRVAFGNALREVVERVRDEPGTPRWHVRCQYDPAEPRPPKKHGLWRNEVRDALRKPGPGGRLQLLPKRSRAGRGVVVVFHPAGNAGSFSSVREDTGLLVVGAALDRIGACVEEKARKVAQGPRARCFTSWWLILVEEFVVFHSALSEAEWTTVRDGVRRCKGADQWNRVVLLSKFTGDCTLVYERS